MTRKTLLHSLPIVMTAMMMAACSHKDVAEITGDDTLQPRTWQVSINAGPADATRAISIGGNNEQTLYTNWDPNDAVEVVKEGVSVGTLYADVSEGNSAYATLTGTLTGTFSVGDAVTLYYHSASIDYTGQVGTLGGVSTNKSYLTATSTVKSVDGSGGFLSMSNAAFSPMQAYLALSFTYKGSPLSIVSFDVWAEGGKLVKTKALDGTTTYATEAEPLTITPASATDRFFIAFRDEYGDANELHFMATDELGESYVYEGSKNLELGKFYTGTVTMTDLYTRLSDATTSDYGKVVCDGGHLHEAKTAVPAGCTAVGILGKVTSTGHGLILALHDANDQSWNSFDSGASVTTYAGTTLKLLSDAARGANLSSYTTLGTTPINVSNWCVAQLSDYSAIFQNLGSTKKDERGFVHDANVNAFITTGVGGSAVNGVYWTATRHDQYAVYYFNGGGYGLEYDEDDISHVRPVLGF